MLKIPIKLQKKEKKLTCDSQGFSARLSQNFKSEKKFKKLINLN